MENAKINIKIKLSALWVTVYFIFAYVDILGKYELGHLESAIAGRVADFQITQVWLLGVTVMMTLPALMVFLSLVLKPKVNRLANIIVAILKILIIVGFLFIGETWAYYAFGSFVEVVLLSLIVWYAWSWPKK